MLCSVLLPIASTHSLAAIHVSVAPEYACLNALLLLMLILSSDLALCGEVAHTDQYSV